MNDDLQEWGELPEGWRWKVLPEVAEIIMGQSPPGSTYNADGNGLPFYQGKTDFGELHPTLRVWCTKPTKIAVPNDILMSVRAPVGPTNIADSECAIGRGLCIIRPRNGMPSRYLREYFRHIEDQIADMGKGSTFTSISRADLETIEVPLPPLPEQHRIVAKIERLLSESRTAREALDKVPALLKRFRQSVLAKAFRGELTGRDPGDEPASVLLERIREERRRRWEEDLRAAGRQGKDPKKAKYAEPEPTDTSDLPELPGGWCWVNFEELLVELKNGYFSKTPAFEPPGIPILRISAVRPLSISLASPRFLQEKIDVVSQYQLQDGDLLFTRYNGSLDLVGVCGMVRGLNSLTIYPDKLIRARVLAEHVLPEYLELYFATRVPRHIIEGKAKSSAGQQGISGKDLKSIPVAVASLAEQRRIVAKIESLFAQAEAIERAVEAARRRAEKVDQAVLARAFRGEL
ncbi:MAG: hypothetical protein FJ247_13660 [Nitrospira sp.]|nr:hypothetical protein [Nitrospira sp.]